MGQVPHPHLLSIAHLSNFSLSDGCKVVSCCFDISLVAGDVSILTSSFVHCLFLIFVFVSLISWLKKNLSISILALLRYNSHIIQFTHLKSIHCFLVYSQYCATITMIHFRTFSSAPKVAVPWDPGDMFRLGTPCDLAVPTGLNKRSVDSGCWGPGFCLPQLGCSACFWVCVLPMNSPTAHTLTLCLLPALVSVCLQPKEN